jgi:hypothetical protein
MKENKDIYLAKICRCEQVIYECENCEKEIYCGDIYYETPYGLQYCAECGKKNIP